MMQKNILVVDNDPLILELVAELLEAEGHRVVTAEDGLSAIEILDGFTPDIMFVDLIMPRISGERLCEIVRKSASTKNCYLVVLSGAVLEKEHDLLRIGADAYIQKAAFHTMAAHILSVVKESTHSRNSGRQPAIRSHHSLCERRMTKELLSQNQHMEIILESICDGILEVYSGKIVYANTSALDSLGLKREQVLGACLSELFDAQTGEKLEKLLESDPDALSLYEQDSPIEINGRLLKIKRLAVRDEEETHIVLLHDVTRQKEAEAEKQRLEEKLYQAQKMEIIGTLAGGVAHDLNNILSGIVSYPELLMMDLKEDSHLRRALETIQKSGQKAVAIVQDLLTLARRGVVVKDIINLNHIIREYQFSPEFQKLKDFHPNFQLDVDLDPALLNIRGSSVHLSKTVMNLVSNAAEAMPNGGKISIRTENQYIDRPIQGYERIEEGDYVVLNVIDSGLGISKGDLNKIFEPFYTKKVMGRSGTGLGMAVVWGTVKDHHGHINVQSTEWVGTTFTLYFPATRQCIDRTEIKQAIENYMGDQEVILIVDDVEEQREIASGMLKKLGYSVLAVPSGEEAVEHMKHNAADLILLDIIMEPGMDGLEAYKKILEFHPNQKAIIASGFSETERVKEAQHLGAGTYIKKPYLLETIGQAIKAALDKHDTGRPFIQDTVENPIPRTINEMTV